MFANVLLVFTLSPLCFVDLILSQPPVTQPELGTPPQLETSESPLSPFPVLFVGEF